MPAPWRALAVSLSAIMTVTGAAAQDSLWETPFKAGIEAKLGGHAAEAEKQFTAALKAADQFGPTDGRRTNTIRRLAGSLDDQGKYAQAESLIKDQMKNDEKNSGADGEDVAEDLSVLATIYRHQGRNAEAEPLYVKSLAIWQKRYGLQNTKVAEILVNLAILHEDTGASNDVETYLSRARKIYEMANGVGDSTVADCLDLLGAFYVRQNRYDEAEPVLKQAVVVRQNLADKKDLARSSSALAALYVQQEKYSDAEALLDKAMGRTIALKGKDHPDTAVLLKQLAETYQAEGIRGARVTKLLEEALAVETKESGKDSAQVTETRRKLARAFLDCDDYARAESLYMAVLASDEETNGAEHPKVARDLADLATLYLNQGRYADAEPMYMRSLAIVEKVRGPEDVDVAACLNNLALLYFNQGKYGEAEKLAKRALAIRTKALGANHRMVAWNLNILAGIERSEGKFAEAENDLKQALTIEKSSPGSQHAETAVNVRDLADLYQGTGNLSAAETTARQLVAIDEASLGKNDPAVASDLLALAGILMSRGKKEEAEALMQKAAAIKQGLPGAARAGNLKALSPMVTLPAMNPVKDKWALVVGISNFKDPSINLKFAAKDATDFKNYLINDAGFKSDHVKLLTDAAATRENIVAYLGDQWLKKVAKPDDLVVVYISSHGTAAEQQAGDTNFIVPYDSNLQNVILTGIPMQWLTSGIGNLLCCRRIVMVLDVCHSGAAGAGKAAAGSTADKDGPRDVASAKGQDEGGEKGLSRSQEGFDPDKIQVGKGQMILAASQAEQISWESKRYANGVFTRRLLEGLHSHGAGTGLSDAFAYMQAKVEEEVLRDRAQEQTPVLIDSSWQGGDVVLSVVPTEPRQGLSETATARQH
jgi:tetratricopeptide (TPR) repeat protein